MCVCVCVGKKDLVFINDRSRQHPATFRHTYTAMANAKPRHRTAGEQANYSNQHAASVPVPLQPSNNINSNESNSTGQT